MNYDRKTGGLAAHPPDSLARSAQSVIIGLWAAEQ